MTKQWKSITAEEAKRHPLYGVGGWLALFAFVILAGGLQNFGAISEEALKIGMTVDRFLSFPLPSILFMKAALAISLLKVIVIYALLFSKHPKFRTATTYVLVGELPALLLAGISIWGSPGLGEFFIFSLPSWLLGCAVWVTYLQRSKRVRVTFEHTVEMTQHDAIRPFLATVKSAKMMSARAEKGWRWFKWVAIVTLVTIGIKVLFALEGNNSLNKVALALVGGVGGIVVFGGIAYLLGWLTGGDKPQVTPAMPPLTASSTVANTATIDATYEKIDQELMTDNLDRATWIRAQGDAEGNADRAKALYIKYRATRLLAENRVESGHQATFDPLAVGKPAKKYSPRFVATTAGILVSAVVAAIGIGFYTQKPAPAKGGFIPFDMTKDDALTWDEFMNSERRKNLEKFNEAGSAAEKAARFGLTLEEYQRRYARSRVLCLTKDGGDDFICRADVIAGIRQ